MTLAYRDVLRKYINIGKQLFLLVLGATHLGRVRRQFWEDVGVDRGFDTLA